MRGVENLIAISGHRSTQAKIGACRHFFNREETEKFLAVLMKPDPSLAKRKDLIETSVQTILNIFINNLSTDLKLRMSQVLPNGMKILLDEYHRSF